MNHTDTAETNARFTPGPWVLDGTSVYALYEIGVDYKDGKLVPKMNNRFSLSVQHRQGWDRDKHYGCSEEEAEANAALIAAAPELVEALKEAKRCLLQTMELRDAFYVKSTNCLDDIDAALLKALPKTGVDAS